MTIHDTTILTWLQFVFQLLLAILICYCALGSWVDSAKRIYRRSHAPRTQRQFIITLHLAFILLMIFCLFIGGCFPLLISPPFTLTMLSF